VTRVYVADEKADKKNQPVYHLKRRNRTSTSPAVAAQARMCLAAGALSPGLHRRYSNRPPGCHPHGHHVMRNLCSGVTRGEKTRGGTRRVRENNSLALHPIFQNPSRKLLCMELPSSSHGAAAVPLFHRINIPAAAYPWPEMHASSQFPWESRGRCDNSCGGCALVGRFLHQRREHQLHLSSF
jgi:hypothetical protein